MDTSRIEDEKTAALADFYELFGVAFGFPTLELAQALADGAFESDYNAIVGELGTSPAFPCADLGNVSVDRLFSELKREFSRMYLSPGWLRVIYPYESAFIFRKSDEKGMPAMIVTRAAADVEAFMRRAGILPEDYAREPVDRIDKELAVMSAAYVNQLAASGSGKEAVAKRWASLACEFRTRHLDTWVSDFMRCTITASRCESYAVLARAFLAVYEAYPVKSASIKRKPCMSSL